MSPEAQLPRFDGQIIPNLQAQNTGPPASPAQANSSAPIRVPPLTPEKVSQYTSLFVKSGAQNGILPGVVAKQIFERAGLPNDVLGRIWGLSDTQGRGALDTTEFIIAMHLLASCKEGSMKAVPNTLPPGLYEAAARKPPARGASGSRPGSGVPPVPTIPPSFATQTQNRSMSPIDRRQISTPLSGQSTGDGWLVTPADKAKFDQNFASLDPQQTGYITGEQAVTFFGNARLPEEILAQIWDLADTNSAGRLDKDEFAVAMFLIRQQRASKDGRGILPQTLPPALVPPSKRGHQLPPSQPTAPAFDSAPVTQPRSAADDLFGLDVLGPSAPATSTQYPQSTGGSSGSPFQTARSPPPPASSSPQTLFKPFVPSSTFGRGIAPQQTGTPTPQQQQARGSGNDDLLGDADPEQSSRLTNDTTELANLSNQVGSLSNQMKETQSTKASSERELAQTSQQKRDFEARLAHLRTAYEAEVKDVKSLQERLAASKNDTKRLQSDYAMVDGMRQDLQTQKLQLTAAFTADQQENAALKEKIRQANAEVAQLKPQLEKLKSDARQQKGLVAINKKQLATNEAERERVQAEMAAAAKELEEAKQEAAAVPIPPSAIMSPQLASPASSANSNPFFRRQQSNVGQGEPFSPPATSAREAPAAHHNNFDNIFGPSFASPTATAAAPQVSFRSESPVNIAAAPAHPASSTRSVSNLSNVGSETMEPPPPPPATQITSAALPMRQPLDRAESVSSSVRVAPPASRISPADTPRVNTPSGSSNYSLPQAAAEHNRGIPSQTTGSTLPTHSGHHTPTVSTTTENPMEKSFGAPSAPSDMPGGFPSFDTPRTQTPQPERSTSGHALAFGAGGATAAAAAALGLGALHHKDSEQKEDQPLNDTTDASEVADGGFDQYFEGSAHKRTPSEQATDFDSAFATMKTLPATNGDANTSNKEFPPIQEVEDDDSDDSSEAPLGFDDDFNSKSPPRTAAAAASEPSTNAAGKQPEIASAVPSFLGVARPPFQSQSSNVSILPEADAMKSPPAYVDAAAEDNPNHFPQEYKGLLPEREVPTSPPPTADSVSGSHATTAVAEPAYGPESAKSPPPFESTATAATVAAAPSQNDFDFDSVFAGMKPAQHIDESSDDDDDAPFSNARSSEFDPTFDSPPNQKTPSTSVAPNPHASNGTTFGNSRGAFDNNFDDSSPPQPKQSSSTSAYLQATSPSQPADASNPAANHDWDAIFSGIDGPSTTNAESANDAFDDFRAPPTKPSVPINTNTMPHLDTSPQQTTTAIDSPSSVYSPPDGAPPSQRKYGSSGITLDSPASLQTTEGAPVQAPKAMPTNSSAPKRPEPGRALSTGTEHDDPILKSLTSMGFKRGDALQALERFDYNMDKVRTKHP